MSPSILKQIVESEKETRQKKLDVAIEYDQKVKREIYAALKTTNLHDSVMVVKMRKMIHKHQEETILLELDHAFKRHGDRAYEQYHNTSQFIEGVLAVIDRLTK